MTAIIIITFCALLLLAYIFDITSAKTKIPSVILLLGLGWLVKQISFFLGFDIPDLNQALPVFATLGLILIVLEGSLELEIHKGKMGLITKCLLGAIFPMLILIVIYSYGFYKVGNYPIYTCILNAIPFAVISSAIAIPSVRNLTPHSREFVTYESSLSDILGVLIFNFIAYNTVFNGKTFAIFGGQILIILIVSVIATIGLAILLKRITHHIKFVPIILIIILIYELLKINHLPSLIFILIFGLFLENLDKIRAFNRIRFIKVDDLFQEVKRFKVLTMEGAFLIRSMFFLLFGYQLKTAEIFNTDTFLWAIGITGCIYIFRFLQLLISRIPPMPLLFVAPRGLITILLFMNIVPEHNIPFVNNSLIIQVILLTAIAMMFGMMFNKEEVEDISPESSQDDNEVISLNES